MFKLPVRTWILNAAAVFAGHHGAVTERAERSGCSRETVYQHAHKIEQRLVAESAAEDQAELRAEIQRREQVIAGLERAAEGEIRLDKAKLRELVVTAFAMGVSLRQIEDLLGVLLPAGEVPDHSTLGRWVQAAAQQAGPVLKALDCECGSRVQTLAVDEIFFGGDRPWWGSSRRA
jgi:AcrR family transcriptional regulator